MGMGFIWIFWILLIVVLVVIIGQSFSKRRGANGNSNDTTLAILEQRYAKGEIGKAEFEEKKKEIMK